MEQRFVTKPIYVRTQTTTALGEITETYTVSANTIDFWISEVSYDKQMIDVMTQKIVNYTAVARKGAVINVGDRIDNIYEVLHINNTGRFTTLNLSKVE